MTLQTEPPANLENSSLAEVNRQMLVFLDFGSLYSELIARRIRETEVYSEVLSYRTTAEQLKQLNPRGIILSGGQTRCTTPGHLTAIPKSGIWGFPFWESVTVCS